MILIYKPDDDSNCELYDTFVRELFNQTPSSSLKALTFERCASDSVNIFFTDSKPTVQL